MGVSKYSSIKRFYYWYYKRWALARYCSNFVSKYLIYTDLLIRLGLL